MEQLVEVLSSFSINYVLLNTKSLKEAWPCSHAQAVRS